ncbi:MAG: ABC transporter permease [Methanobacteriota archaeon]|nr:MAG: ABC transporter permease [Euryarchaeota archaeon]
MKRILADVTAFGRQYLRSRVGTFFALAFPVILILLFGAIFSSSGTPKVPLAVQDLDSTFASHGFVQALNNTTLITYQAIPTNVNFQDYMRAHSINVALQIPAGFQAALIQAEMGNASAKVNVTLAGDRTQSSFGIVYSAVAAVATAFNLKVANATEVVSVDESQLTVRQFGYIDFFLPGIIGFTVLTTPLFGMTSICAEYRTRRFFKLLATTKLSKAEWLAAKVVFYVLLLFLSVAIMMLVGVVVFGMQAALTPLAVLLIIAGTFEFTSLGMVLGIFVRDPGTGEALANAIGFPMMFLAGSFFPIDAMPPFLRTLARGLPLTYINEGLRATMVFGNDGTALTYLLITLGFAVVFFVVGARGLSWKSK